MSPLDVLTRGVDSSGRAITMTRQHWQFYDRVNADAANGMAVLIQGGFMGDHAAAASGTVHRLAKCSDWRVWNLSDPILRAVRIRGRELMGSQWLRGKDQGFDPHIHTCLLGDEPADAAADAQARDWINGGNGIGGRDDDIWRPSAFHNYIYLPEDDMFEDADRKLLQQIDRKLDAEKSRDQRERDKDKERFSKLITAMGNTVDQLTVAINSSEGEVKSKLTRIKKQIMTELKDNPDVTGVDNPSDDAMNRLDS